MLIIPKGYTTIENIENYLLIDIAETFKPRVREWIAMMERYIEQQTGRVFIADATASIRRYDGNNKQDLFIDEVVGITEIRIGGVVIPVVSYLIYPANELPKTRIRLRERVFNKGEQNIDVNARWGYSVACPLDITFAATILTAGIINFSGLMTGEIKSEKLGDYTVAYGDKDWQDLDRAKEIIIKYTRIVI